MVGTSVSSSAAIERPSGGAPSRQHEPDLAARFAAVRQRTLELCAPLSVEDHLLQPMADASPAKWHLAHTTWFFEAFVLERHDEASFSPEFGFLFNSYYEAAGPRVERARRGMLSRPSLPRVHQYRAAVDQQVLEAVTSGRLPPAMLARLELGLHHEQQHQELILTDLKCALGTQPTSPAYRTDLRRGEAAEPSPLAFRSFDEGIIEIGATAEGFAFDNERPRHRVLLQPFLLATRPICNAEVLAFIDEGGYRAPQLWLSDGWQAVQAQRWEAPMYWQRRDSGFAIYDLTGVRAVDPADPACHLSYYEADAIARWSGARLPTEQEWEWAAAAARSDRGNFADDELLHPAPARGDGAIGGAIDGAIGGAIIDQLFGDVWEWTASSYSSYPGFRPLAGALGEYNGKFMSGQQVLRGGSCFTPRGHVRASYRNFFPPAARWQMSGVRLARDA
jgi:ergothioneine biosynthesis protein EgtB